jgi:ParB-like chromosome segregation protein Spo0J
MFQKPHAGCDVGKEPTGIMVTRTAPEDLAALEKIESPSVRVPIRLLHDAETPRLNGMDHDHVKVLAEAPGPLPPILVHRATMQIIDGMHRRAAAELNQREDIEVRFFDGDLEEAFRIAVEANTTHGLPLTLPERRAAATRLIRSRPELSDRAVAATTGMSAKTVSALRKTISDGNPDTRIGRDGRARPLSTAEGRVLASQAIANRPELSLREIAREAGISIGTARNVRARVNAGEDPVPPRLRPAAATAPAAPAGTVVPHSPPTAIPAAPPSEQVIEMLLDSLRRDPSLRFTDTGRAVLRWLSMRMVTTSESRQAAESIPPHSAKMVAQIAQEYSRIWRSLADELHRRSSECV